MADRRYRIIREIGRGGMGTVYAAKRVTSHGPVALKVMRASDYGSDLNSHQRFSREATIPSSLKHRNVVDIIDFGELHDRTTYDVMERLEGRDLSSIIAEQGPLRWPQARELLAQVLAALRVAHREGVIHRDIKPASIVVLDAPDRRGREQVKVLDFGIARLQDADELSLAPAKISEILGTALYMAPARDGVYTGDDGGIYGGRVIANVGTIPTDTDTDTDTGSSTTVSVAPLEDAERRNRLERVDGRHEGSAALIMIRVVDDPLKALHRERDLSLA